MQLATAAAAGFRVGDLIEQMGDRRLENIEDFEAALFTAEPDRRRRLPNRPPCRP